MGQKLGHIWQTKSRDKNLSVIKEAIFEILFCLTFLKNICHFYDHDNSVFVNYVNYRYIEILEYHESTLKLFSSELVLVVH